MSEKSWMKLGMERCQQCNHRWIDYEGIRGKCYMCGGTDISECISLKEVREAIQALRREDKRYLDKHAKRTIILKQRYREIAELSLQRAQEIFAKVKEHYTSGDLSDKVLEQLIIAFRLFSELGVHKSAAAIAYMAAIGYAQRGLNKAVKSPDDLDDLVAARQWFMRLGAKEWEAAINLHIGEKAMATMSSDPKLLQLMTQVSLWHFHRAREYYYQERNTAMVDRIHFDIGQTTQMLNTYARGASQIEAARIAARSTSEHGEHVRRGLESLGHSMRHGLTALGEHVEVAGSHLSRSLQVSSAALSANVTNAMYTIASSKGKGRSLDRRMTEVGQLIASTSREVPEGYFRPIKELGAKFAIGAAGSATSKDITREPDVINLAESVLPEVEKSAELSAREVEEPTIKITGTLLDALVTKGFSKAAGQARESETSGGADRS